MATTDRSRIASANYRRIPSRVLPSVEPSLEYAPKRLTLHLTDLDFLSQLGGISITQNSLPGEDKASYKPPTLVRLAQHLEDDVKSCLARRP